MGRNVAEENISRSVGLLISMLVRYPEIGTINFDPQKETLKFTFLLTKLLRDTEYEGWEQRLRSSLEAYWYLDNKPVTSFAVNRSSFGKITVLELVRDVGTLTQEEIALVVAIMRDQFGPLLVADHNESLLEEDLLIQEELIEEMLEDLRDAHPQKNLIAFREEGRVLVFNK